MSRSFLLNDFFQKNCPHFLRSCIGQGPKSGVLGDTEMNGTGPASEPSAAGETSRGGRSGCGASHAFLTVVHWAHKGLTEI